MTTPEERTRAVISTRNFLEILASADAIEIPGLVQSTAVCLLRHYPLNIDLDFSAALIPTVWAPPGNRKQASDGKAHPCFISLFRKKTSKK
ncbi:BPSL0761 family protein [Caballeronia grimmiae]|uniref:BPSL0761 family protein n=1 Tax=Caballeronia grimmiae TaxID=1071679 RepID=UPI0038B9492A